MNYVNGNDCLFQDTGVGKSSIVWRFVEDSFDPNINPTIGYGNITLPPMFILYGNCCRAKLCVECWYFNYEHENVFVTL